MTFSLVSFGGVFPVDEKKTKTFRLDEREGLRFGFRLIVYFLTKSF